MRGPFAHNYWALMPNQRDGLVVLTMEYVPNDNNLLRDNINFWVVDADGMRRIMGGARPEDVAIGAGGRWNLGRIRASCRVPSTLQGWASML